MFCKQCGQNIGAQSYCQYCGTPTGFSSGTHTTFATQRVARHLRTLGILWVVFAVFLVLRWFLLLPLLHRLFGGYPAWSSAMSANPWLYGAFHSSWLLHAIAIAVFVRAILSLAVGIALLSRQPWGRIFAIIIAVLTLLRPILGTLLAVYTLWVLISRNAGEEYDRLALFPRSRP